jgi:hypothetical protein
VFFLSQFDDSNVGISNRKMQLNALSTFCPSKIITDNRKNYPNCNGCLEILREIRIPPEELFVNCKFQKNEINCTESLKETVLRDAMCFTFNGIDAFRQNNSKDNNIRTREWTIDEGYKLNATLNSYPRRSLEAGKQFGFSITLQFNKYDNTYQCRGKPGFWVNL